MQVMELFGSVAIITHASSRPGRITARALFHAGVSVYLVDSNEIRGREACESLRDYGHELQHRLFLRLESNKSDAVENIAERILNETDGIDIFVNVSAPSSLSTDSYGGDLLRAVLPSMVENHRGKIINVSAEPARASSLVSGHSGAGGNQTATSSFVFEMAHHGISVNDICIERVCAQEHALLPDEGDSDNLAYLISNEGYPLEITDATLLFARATSNHITGQTLRLKY